MIPIRKNLDATAIIIKDLRQASLADALRAKRLALASHTNTTRH